MLDDADATGADAEEFRDDLTLDAADGTMFHAPDPVGSRPARAAQERYKRALDDPTTAMLNRREIRMSMDTETIRMHLAGHRVEAHSDYALSISQSVIRAEVDGVALVAVGSDQLPDA